MCHIPAVLIIVEELLTHQMSQIVSEESSFILAATSGCKVRRLFFGLMAPPKIKYLDVGPQAQLPPLYAEDISALLHMLLS